MKKRYVTFLGTLALGCMLAGTAQAQFINQVGTAAGYAADGAAAYFGAKDLLLYKTAAPSSPKRPADEVTSDGAHIWKDKLGRVVCVKLASGPVFVFTYDKGNTIQKVVEPNGARLTRKANGREWTRRSPDNKRAPVYVTVSIGSKYEIHYLNDDGGQTIYNTNGDIVELERFNQQARIIKVTDPKGRTTEFGYDAEGKPFSVKTSDGFVLVRGDEGKWYRELPGTTRDTSVPYTVVRSYEPDVKVTITTPSNSVAYSPFGIAEQDNK